MLKVAICCSSGCILPTEILAQLSPCFMQCRTICQENNTKCKKGANNWTNPAQTNVDTKETLSNIFQGS